MILTKSKLASRNIFFNSKDSFITCSIIAAVFALIHFLLVQFFPKIVNKVILYVGLVVLLILIICTFTYPTEHMKSKILIGLLLVLFFVIVGLTVYFFREAVEANGVFLHQASIFIKDYPLVLINIPIFLGITALAAFIMTLELNSIWTHTDLVF